MTVQTMALYVSCLIVFTMYVLYKYRNRAYIFSTFNVSLFIYTFDIIISPVFFNSDSSWYGLGIASAAVMKDFLNRALLINCLGYIVYIITLFFHEFDNKQPRKILRLGAMVSNTISNQLIDITFIIIVAAWHGICWVFCNGYPLLNGRRTFYLDLYISPIYLFLNQAILIFTFYYAVRFAMKKRRLMYMLLGIFTIAMQGNRAALITNLAFPMVIIFIYKSIINKKQKKDPEHESDSLWKKLGKRKGIKRILVFAPFLVLLGLWLKFIRSGSNSNISNMIFEMIYGNTFADIRDGAYILKGFSNNTNSNFLIGKTYMSALISFVPSSISKFRYIWSWGRYTTTGLFGYTNHFGLRGGNVMEAYINFGWVGIIIFGFLQGYVAAKLEKIFYGIFIDESLKIQGKEYFVYYIVYLINGVLASSSSAYNIYVLLVMMFCLVFVSNLICRR